MTYIMTEYDNALREILSNGVHKSNRTGIDTLSIFGMQTRYRIDKRFPIVTKRKMFPKSVFAELLWMLSGSTNVNDLEKLGSKIWSAWRDPAFETKHGYTDGELGPIYGWNLRHFGVNYNERNIVNEVNTVDENGLIKNDYKEVIGCDQIAYMVNELKTNKFSRRILLNMWDPAVVTTDKVRLPPCHYSFQLSVGKNDRLSGMLTQRSADYPIGVPANIQFYSALIYMFAQQCGLQPYEFVHSTADSHIYTNQIEAVEKYLDRPEISSPQLVLNKAPSIDDYKITDFEIVDYNPLSAIKIPVAV